MSSNRRLSLYVPVYIQVTNLQWYVFSALKLLVGWQEGHPGLKNWVVGYLCGYLSGICIWLSWCHTVTHCYSLYLASVKSRLVLPFWYRLIRVVPDEIQRAVKTVVVVVILVSLSTLYFNSIYNLNTTHQSDHCYLCLMKCHLIFFSYRSGLTSMQHTTSHTN